jgi:hypothetical protein
MKSLFGCLLCLVLGTAQSFALKGGPVFGKGNVRTTGIYAGVLTPGPLSPGANSIGLFSITIPRTGTGTGSVVIFTAGQTYTGTFVGVADPDSGKLFGEINASFPYISFVETVDSNGNITFTSVTVAAIAAGRVDASIRANTNLFSAATARIVGTSNIQFSLTVNNPFTEIGYLVLGFKQQDI